MTGNKKTSASLAGETDAHSPSPAGFGFAPDFITPRKRLASATYWLSLGVDLVPIQPMTKRLVARFGPHLKHITRQQEARYWFFVRAFNIGVVCDRRLVALDFDDLNIWNKWHAGPGAGLRTHVERTGRGMRVFFFAEYKGPSLVVAGIELKAAGAVVIVAPSIHPSGVPYVVIDDSPIHGVSDLSEFLPLLSKTLEDARAARSANDRRLPSPARPSANLQDGPVAQLKASLDIVRVARSLVPDLRNTDGGQGRWFVGRCPFHPDRNPSFWVDAVRGLWGCRSPQCAQRGTHDVLNLEALRRGLTVPEAVKILMAEGRSK